MIDPTRQHVTMTTITSSVEVVTPSLAAAWLDTMVRNRPMSRAAVNRYKADMSNSRWQFTGEAVKFDREGHLVDGQHRLTALSELPHDSRIQMLVVRGVPLDAQTCMDQGRKRTSASQLQMIGVKDAALVAAGVRFHLMHATGLMFRDTAKAVEMITAPAIEEWVTANAAPIAQVREFLSHVRQTNGTPSVAYCAALEFAMIDPAAAESFFRGLAKGAGGERHPITVLDKRLSAARRTGSGYSKRDELALFINAWNAWRQGKQLRTLRTPGKGWTAATFPKVLAA